MGQTLKALSRTNPAPRLGILKVRNERSATIQVRYGMLNRRPFGAPMNEDAYSRGRETSSFFETTLGRGP